MLSFRLINLKISEDSCLFGTVSVGGQGYLVESAMCDRESFDNFLGNLTGDKRYGTFGLSQVLSPHL